MLILFYLLCFLCCLCHIAFHCCSSDCNLFFGRIFPLLLVFCSIPLSLFLDVVLHIVLHPFLRSVVSLLFVSSCIMWWFFILQLVFYAVSFLFVFVLFFLCSDWLLFSVFCFFFLISFVCVQLHLDIFVFVHFFSEMGLLS